MANDKITISDAITGETIDREMTQEEQSIRDGIVAEIHAEEESWKLQAEDDAKAKAALLVKLGITSDEAKLLLS